MPAGFSSDSHDDLIQAEIDVQARIGTGLDIDYEATAAVSNIFRAANVLRGHFEREVLADVDLSFSAFTVLWVLWIWGDQEASRVAEEAAISRGTLTGVVSTLERRGLATRSPHPRDRRSVVVGITDDGRSLMVEYFPRFNREEVRLVEGLTKDEKLAAASFLRAVVRAVAP